MRMYHSAARFCRPSTMELWLQGAIDQKKNRNDCSGPYSVSCWPSVCPMAHYHTAWRYHDRYPCNWV